MLRPTIAIDPGVLPPAARERDDRTTTLEIVPHLFAVEHRQKRGVVQPVQLAARGAGAVDQRRPPAEIEQAPTHAALAEKRRAAREQRMQDVAAHERSVGEQQRRRVAAGTAAGGQEVSTAWRTAPRKSRSGMAPSNCTRSLITTFGTPITLYERDAVEADAVVAGALDDDRRHLVDAVGLGARAVDGEVEHLDGDLLGERGDLSHELLVLPTQVGGGELLRKHHELHGPGDALEF